MHSFNRDDILKGELYLLKAPPSNDFTEHVVLDLCQYEHLRAEDYDPNSSTRLGFNAKGISITCPVKYLTKYCFPYDFLSIFPFNASECIVLQIYFCNNTHVLLASLKSKLNFKNNSSFVEVLKDDLEFLNKEGDNLGIKIKITDRKHFYKYYLLKSVLLINMCINKMGYEFSTDIFNKLLSINTFLLISNLSYSIICVFYLGWQVGPQPYNLQTPTSSAGAGDYSTISNSENCKEMIMRARHEGRYIYIPSTFVFIGILINFGIGQINGFGTGLLCASTFMLTKILDARDTYIGTLVFNTESTLKLRRLCLSESPSVNVYSNLG